MPHAPGSEGGWALVESIAASAILFVVVAAVLSSLDASALSSGLSRSRATAATLAEQDQERLRSMRAVDLSNYTEQRTVNLGGGPYTITSLVEWLRDFNGEPLSCTNGSAQADYMLIRSTVTSTPLARHPVSLESLLAAPVGSFGPTQGTFGIQVVDRSATPVQNMDVSIAGPDSATLPTNELGCAIFGYIPTGSYTATLDREGWVDVSGVGVVSRSGTVTGGNVNAITIQYDEAATVGVGFDTVVGGGQPQTSASKSVTAGNSGVPPSGARRFTTSARTASIQASSLFPFSSGYVIYAGSCAAANPQLYDADYFADHPGVVDTAPGSSHPVVVRVPAMNVAVTRLGIALAGAHVVLTATGSGCTEKTTALTNLQGALSDPGMPFGSYTVCADDGLRSKTTSGVINGDPAGTPVVNLAIPITGSLGTCP